MWRAASFAGSLLGLSTLTAIAGADVRTVQLNGPLASGTTQDVSGLRISPEGFLVYEVEDAGRIHLWVARAGGGGEPIDLGLVGTDLFGVERSYRVVRNGREVLFGWGGNLMVAPIEGGTPQGLLANIADWIEPDLLASEDGRFVVARATELLDETTLETRSTLLVVNRDDGSFASLGQTTAVGLTADRIVYGTSQTLLSRALAGGPVADLLPGNPPDRFLVERLLSGNGDHVVFETRVLATYELLSVPTTGGPAVSLSAGLLGPFVDLVTVDAARVAFLSKTAPLAPSGIHLAPSAGGAPTRLTPPDRPVGRFRIHLAPGRAIAATSDGVIAVPLDGSQVVTELSSFPPTFHLSPNAFETSADGTRVVFVADPDGDGTTDLYAAPTDGSRPPMRIGSPLPAGHEPIDFQVAPNGAWVAYRTDLADPDRIELFAALVDVPMASVRLNDELVAGGDVREFVIGAGGQRVFYRADQDEYDAIELFGVEIAAPGTSLRLNAPLEIAPQRSVAGGVFSPDGRTVVYSTRELGDPLVGLYARRLDRGGPAVPLTQSILGGGVVTGFAPASGRVVFSRRDMAPSFAGGTFSVPLDGSEPPVLLFQDTTAVLSPDGEWVVGHENGLRSRRSDGSGPAISLTTGISGVQSTFHVSPDSRRVVFAAGTVPRFELFSVPVDGSAPPVRISEPYATGTGGGVEVRRLGFSPDSAWVLYLADPVQHRDELFRASIDGTSDPVRLNGTLVAGGNVLASLGDPPARVAPDGTTVVYAADQDVDGAIDLYAVPLDASAPPVRLSRHETSGNVAWSSFRLTAERVVYQAGTPSRLHAAALDGSGSPFAYDLDPVNQFVLGPQGTFLAARTWTDGLWSLPSDGSGPGVQLSADDGLDLRQYDGGPWIGFSNGQSVHVAPVDGSQPPRLMTPGVVRVASFGIVPGGRAITFLSDDEVEESYQLYLSELRPHAARR